MGTWTQFVFDVRGLNEKQAARLMDRMLMLACAGRGRGRKHRCGREVASSWEGPIVCCDECGERTPKHDAECSSAPMQVTGSNRVTITGAWPMDSDTTTFASFPLG
jgi:hypothetical protein